MLGSMPFASTRLTANISDISSTIPVTSTNGFPRPGIIVIGDERIAYSGTSNSTFDGNPAQPLTRGSGGTIAVAHSSGATVRMIESSLINSSIDYNLAIIADVAGLQAFLTAPLAIFDIIKSFAVAPFAFLGTDLQILTILWGICFVGMLVSFFISMAGGRRV